MEDKQPLRAAIYARISLDKKEEAGVKRQVHLCTLQAEADEATIVSTLIDNNVSAFSGEFRPEYDKLLQAIEAREIDIVYVYALDRLTRRTRDTLTLFELCEKHHVKIKATRGYGIDPSDPALRLTIIILGLIAEQESIDRAARIKAACVDRARTGRPKTGGYRMMGYESDAKTIVPEETQAVLDAADMVVSGKTLREAVREVFDKRGILTTRGNPMTAPTLRDILLNPRMRGMSTFTPTDPDTGYRFNKDREVVGKGSWPAIIGEELGEKIDAVLRDPSRRRNHVGNAPTRYLASVLVCTCGGPMYSRIRTRKDGSKHRFYACKREKIGERHTAIGSEEVDDLVSQVIIARMSKPDALEVLRSALTPEDDTLSEKMQSLFQGRTALLARREALEESVIDGEIDTSTFARVEKKIAAQLARVDEELQKITETLGADPLAVELGAEDVIFADWWESASVEDKRRLTKLLMDIHIQAGKQGAKKFDPTRVKITWKN